MSTSKQRRQAAQRHLQRQLERRTVLARRRRRNAALTAAAVVAVLAIGTVLLLTGVFSGKHTTAAAGTTASSAPSSAASSSAVPTAARTTNPDGTVSCSFVPDTSGNTSLKDVGTPPNPKATPAKGTSILAMNTNQGNLRLTLDRAKAPCAASSFTYLASKKFFDNSVCHRLVNQPNFGVLQCGDPTGTGAGGPSYKYGEEVTPKTTYPKGTIAMAKTSAPNTTGSQFFLCFVDTQLPPEYTVVGTVDQAGLAVLQKVAAGGIKGAGATGDGAPNLPVKISTLSVAG